MPGGGDLHVHMHGNNYGMGDFNEAVAGAVEYAARRGKFSGIPGVKR